jgi:hypothetical protein
MTDITIRMATDDNDVAWAADLIARSFDHLAANHYLVPDDDQRVPVMREYFLLLSEHAAQGAGEVLVTEDAVVRQHDRNQRAPRIRESAS